MTCDMRCHLAAGHLAVERDQLHEAAEQLPQVERALHAAIECGAMVDPWNILGFGGQYSLFPAIENTIHDHRVDELLDMIGDIFALYVRIHKAAAASGDTALQQKLAEGLAELARWWDKFATPEVGSIEGISGQATLESAERVATALRAWHEAGAAAGDVGFWRQHVDEFHSAKAYTLVIETLLDHRDPVAAMALLVQWLSQAEEIPLTEEDYSFHDLALLWMEDLWRDEHAAASPAGTPPSEGGSLQQPVEQVISPSDRWPLARKFLDYLEANAEEYWQVPHFEMAAEVLGGDVEDEELPEDDEESDIFEAAYEHVTYRDSTDDGIEGDMFDTGESPTDFEMVGEAERIVNRLSFLTTVAHLWKLCATASLSIDAADRDDVLSGWLSQAERNHQKLSELLESVHRYRVLPPRGTQESLIEYDRRRSIKETLLEEIIEACVETADAAAMVRASMRRRSEPGETGWQLPAGDVLSAVLRGDVAEVRRTLPALLSILEKQPLLYVALARGGNPQRIVASRGLQYVLRRLLDYLPRLGLLVETYRLLETAQTMEAAHPVGPGAITEFDRVFEIACQSITRCLAVASSSWNKAGSASRRSDKKLVDCLEQVVEVLLRCWLTHSHGVRLSVLESVSDAQQWRHFRQFIERYGGDLFTQRFMSMGNLRGILHQGVREYLEDLVENPDADEDYRLLNELGSVIPIDEASHWLGVAIEAVAQNYGQYVDYNSITTQSDRGNMLYTLMDFLRLRAHYDRLAWNLRPVILAHHVLVNHGREGAAEIWRSAVAERTSPIAEDHLKRFNRLCKKYGMRLPSIAEHLGERFIRPLEVDQLCALLRPAVDEIRNGKLAGSCKELEAHIARFTEDTPGAGFELPSWLEALEREMERVQWQADEGDDVLDPLFQLPEVHLTKDEVQDQLGQMIDEGPLWTFDDEDEIGAED